MKNLPPIPIGNAWQNPADFMPPGEYELLLRNGTASRGVFNGTHMTIKNYIGSKDMRVAHHMLGSFIKGWRK